MKKLLVFFLSAALVLSMAAVSMAAATVTGDFRYNMYEDETPSVGDDSYADTDLYLRASGNLSDSVYATANFEWVKKNTEGAWTTKVDEFFVTSKYGWGTAKMGYYEYKFTPDRVELKSAGKHVWAKNDATFEVNVPVAEGFVIDGIFQPYAEAGVDDGGYGLAVNYKAENWGAKVTYADFKQDVDLTAFDVYYMFNENMKLWVEGVDYSANDNSLVYDDGMDPVIGFAWTNIADTKLYASLEYAINKRQPDTSNEWNEYVFKAAYKLSNNIGLEFYHYVVGDDLTKDKFRLRYQF
jgi:hypothetical protein